MNILLLLLFGVLKVSELVFASGFPVLEPVKDVGITHLSVLLQLSSDLPYLVSGRVHHPRVEDGFQDSNLFGFRVPSRLRLRAPLFTPRNGSVGSPVAAI